MDFYRILFDTPSDAKQSCVGIMGGGGKTTLLHYLGKELSTYYNVLLTSLTKSAFHPEYEVVFMDSIQNDNLLRFFESHNPLYVMGSTISPEKLAGISEMTLGKFYRQADICLFECDGARNLSLKAHTDTDPTVPSFATHVIILVGADVVNTTLKEGKVHRPDLFKFTWKVNDDFVIDSEFIAKVVTSRPGYLSKISHEVKRVYFVNKADSHPEESMVLAESIFETSGCSTYYGSLRKRFWKEVK